MICACVLVISLLNIIYYGIALGRALALDINSRRIFCHHRKITNYGCIAAEGYQTESCLVKELITQAILLYTFQKTVLI